eukprot:jgi/Chlat1/7182/Chrsp57S09129
MAASVVGGMEGLAFARAGLSSGIRVSPSASSSTSASASALSAVRVSCRSTAGLRVSRAVLPLRRMGAAGRDQSCNYRLQQVQASSSSSAFPDDHEDEHAKEPVHSHKGSDAEFRATMDAMMQGEDDQFAGAELAHLIRAKFGRGYDVQFVKQEFMGRELLALNVMWRYREQRSFPLSELEYIAHLDGVTQYLRDWGAVSFVKNALQSTRQKPRIGKAVSILIDMDSSRSDEWI